MELREYCLRKFPDILDAGGGMVYISEPHPSGGAVVASHPLGRPDQITFHLTDLLGTTLTTVTGDDVRDISLTAFGKIPVPQGSQTSINPTTPNSIAPPAPISQPESIGPSH